jgi:hypothetical protein
MALKKKELKALGLDWGIWVYDCESGLSTIIAKDGVRIEIEIDVDVKKITEGLSKLLPGAAKDKLETAIKALAKKLPKGKVKLFFQINARAGATACVGGKRLVHAQVDLIVSFEAEVTVAGGAGKVKGKVSVFESLANYNELCDCKTAKKIAFTPSSNEEEVSTLDNFGEDSFEETDTSLVTNNDRSEEALNIIDSIGTSTANKLTQKFKLNTLGDLANVDTRLAKKLKAGISEARLKRFKALALFLVEFPSLSPEGADTIVHGLGIDSLEAFSQEVDSLTKSAIKAAVKKAQTPRAYKGEDVLSLIDTI